MAVCAWTVSSGAPEGFDHFATNVERIEAAVAHLLGVEISQFLAPGVPLEPQAGQPHQRPACPQWLQVGLPRDDENRHDCTPVLFDFALAAGTMSQYKPRSNRNIALGAI